MYVHGDRINHAHTGDETAAGLTAPFSDLRPELRVSLQSYLPRYFRPRKTRYTITADQEFIPSINILTIPVFSSFVHIFLRIIRQSFVLTRTRVDSCVQHFKDNFCHSILAIFIATISHFSLWFADRRPFFDSRRFFLRSVNFLFSIDSKWFHAWI